MMLTLINISRLYSCFLVAAAASTATLAASPVAQFDILTVLDSSAKLPPYPYVDYPSTLPNDQRDKLSAVYDRTFVVAGSALRAVEGTVSNRLFLNEPAGLSPAAAQRNYANAIKAMGGVKVNAIEPSDPRWLALQSGDSDAFFEKLGFRGHNLNGLASYDAYLIRHGQNNAWIVVSQLLKNGGTSLLVIEEKPLAHTVGLITAPGGAAKVPVFPYVDYPATLPKDQRDDLAAVHDNLFVVVGNSLRGVEGKVSNRLFLNEPAGLSPFAAQRNYASAIKELGGVKVNSIGPADQRWEVLQGGDSEAFFKKLGLGRYHLNGLASYDVYQIRLGKTNAWIVVSELLKKGCTSLTVIEEKALEQTVSAVTADTLATSLKAQGHVALYLSFDTGLATIRSESAPVVDEVVKLLRAQPNLRLSVEGHTDNVGNKAQNQALSLARAKSVMAAIAAQKVALARLGAAGFGADKPIADNGSEDGRAKNRRVELVQQIADSGRNK